MSPRREQPVFGFAFNVKVVSARIVRKRSSSHFIHFNTDPQCHVVLDVDGREEKTLLVSEKELRWDQTFNLHGHNLSQLRVRLVKSEKTHHKTLGGLSIDVKTLVDFDDGTNRELELASPKSKSEKQCFVTISFSISKEASLAASICKTVDLAVGGVGSMRQPAFLLYDISDTMIPNNVVAIGEDAWTLLLERLSAFVNLVDKLSAIHPYAKIAWDVTSVAYKLIRDQIERDNRIDSLVKTVGGSYKFVSDAQPLNIIEACQAHIQALVQHTLECAYFLREYAKFSSFSTRVLVNIASGVDGKIQHFEEVFTQIQLALQQRLTLQSALTIMRISAKVDLIADDTVLKGMRYHFGARYLTDMAQLPTPHTETVDLISNWINSPSYYTPRLWLLTGDDHIELAVIASNVCRMYDGQNRLASSFFCRGEGDREPTYPEHVFATIGRNLADCDPILKARLYESLGGKTSLTSTVSPDEQFSTFISAPLKSRDGDWESNLGPLVIVINSLHLCGDAPSRKYLLPVLFGRIHELPLNFRILVTSLPASDITNAFESQFGSRLTAGLFWTRLLEGGHRCHKYGNLEFVTNTMALATGLLEKSEARIYPGVILNLLRSLSVKMENNCAYNASVILVLGEVNDIVGSILDRVKNETLPSSFDALKSYLQRAIETVYLAEGINRLRLEHRQTLVLFRSFQDQNHSSSHPFHPVITLRPQGGSDRRTCHPMYFPDLACEPPSRNNAIEPILEWAYNIVDEGLSRTFVLTGAPGSGKTSIAHSIAVHFAKEGRRVWSFFHEICGRAGCRDNMFSAASEWLIGRTAQSQGHPKSLTEQLKGFYAAAIRYAEMGIVGPVVFVFDGLDQSFPQTSVKQFVGFLENDVPRLPPNFRFFMTWTSEAENPVPSAINLQLTCNGPVEIWGTGSKEAAGDAEERRSDYAQDLFDFVHKQQDLFVHEQHPIDLQGRDPIQYADDVMKTLGGDYRVASVVRSLVSTSQLAMPCQGRPMGLEKLYTMEMERFFPHGEEEDELPFLRTAMAMCKVANERSLIGPDFLGKLPGSNGQQFIDHQYVWQALSHYGRGPTSRVRLDVNEVLERLSGFCLVRVGSERVVYLKKSFEDFVFNSAKPHRFSFTADYSLPDVSHLCLSIMESHFKNSRENKIDLRYACQAWARHLPKEQLPYHYWRNLQDFIRNRTDEWIKLLRKWGLTTTVVRSIQELLEWLLTRVDVDTNSDVTLLWFNLVRWDGLDLVRQTRKEVNWDFERTIEKAESVLEPRMDEWWRGDLTKYRSRRKKRIEAMT